MEIKCLTVTTKKYSSFFTELLEKYEGVKDVYAEIDGKRWVSLRFPELVKTWATNRNIRRTHDFKLVNQNEVICMFHDDPDDIFCSIKERAFIEDLASKKILRFEFSKVVF